MPPQATQPEAAQTATVTEVQPDAAANESETAAAATETTPATEPVVPAQPAPVTNPEEEESKGPVPAAATEAAEESKVTAQ